MDNRVFFIPMGLKIAHQVRLCRDNLDCPRHQYCHTLFPRCCPGVCVNHPDVEKPPHRLVPVPIPHSWREDPYNLYKKNKFNCKAIHWEIGKIAKR
jgi:hypothetical protein